MSKRLGKELAKARQIIKLLEERVADWEDWFQQGHYNFMEEGDPYQIIFHNIECPNKDAIRNDCGECWLCETNRLTDNYYRSE
jgi:hypothetical protein